MYVVDGLRQEMSNRELDDLGVVSAVRGQRDRVENHDLREDASSFLQERGICENFKEQKTK